jgi:hypothetical protein
MSTREFTQQEARAIGQRIGIDWSVGDVDLEQFRMGLAVGSSMALRIQPPT